MGSVREIWYAHRRGVIIGGLILLAVVGVFIGLGVVFSKMMQPQPDAEVSPASAGASSSSSASETGGDQPVVADGTCMSVDEADRSSASSVAYTYAAVAFCWDATEDTTMTDGALRARALMSRQWAETIQAPERNALQGQFVEAEQHSAYTEVDLSEVRTHETQRISETQQVLGYRVQWSWRGRDGQRLPGGASTILIGLEDVPGQGWSVTGHDTTATVEDR